MPTLPAVRSTRHTSLSILVQVDTTTNMAAGDTPPWLQKAIKKQKLRDEAIQRFADAETVTSEVQPRAHTDGTQVDDSSRSPISNTTFATQRPLIMSNWFRMRFFLVL